MAGWRQGHDGDGMDRVLWRRAQAWVLIAMFAGLSTSACRRYGEGQIVPCDYSYECQHLPGTLCTDNMCVCALPKHRFCGDKCHPVEVCDGEVGVGGGGAGGGGGGGGASGGECQTAAECKQPGSPRCGEATCENGVCGLTVKPFGKLTSQIRGDCKHLWCDGAGNLVEIEDASDTYNDGTQCTFDLCQAGQPVQKEEANASTCRETQDGVCYFGACVQCIAGMADCGKGFVCHAEHCVASHCANGTWDQGLGETSKDCGGPCGPCDTGEMCAINIDCLTGVCGGGLCKPPTSSDGVKNDSETGIDCGGPPSAARCADGEGCKVGSDCLSGVCWAGKCEPPKCDDGVKNGNETDWDCGGSCGPCP